MENNDRKQLLMKLLAKKQGEKKVSEKKELERSGKTKFPLSMVQRGIWMDCLIDPDSAVYNIPFASRIKGRIDLDAFTEGLRRIIRRHDTWRTVICKEGDEVYQKILPDVDLDFRFFDKRSDHCTEDLIAEEGKRFVAEPIDLAHGPLVRFALYQTEDELYYFVLCAHHIIYDGPSENLFCQELSKEYSAALHQTKSDVEEPEISYGDYAEFNLLSENSEEFDRQLSYWKKELSNIEPTEFPTDHVRPSVRISDGGMIYFDIPKEIEKKIRVCAVSCKVTVNVILFAALNCLLNLYTRSETVSVEITVANREEEKLENLLGCFINNLIIVTEINPKMSFHEVVDATKERIYGALEHKDVPLETLVKTINPPRDLSRTPFSEVGFNYNPRSRMELFLEGCVCEEFGLGDFVVLTDVNFQIHDAGSLWGFVEYNRSLYEKETIERILSHYLIELDRLTEDPDQQIGQMEVVSSEEKETILHHFNNTSESAPSDKTIVELFEEQVKKTPENIATVFEEESWTYAQLNEKANQIAWRLRELGIKPDDLVAIICERSLEMIAGILGILKSGGAYVPMDPSYPEDRIAYMLNDAGTKAILTYKAEVKTEIPVIDLGSKETFEGDKTDPDHVNSLNDLCYCIYTSGTSGEAKGVLIEQRNLSSYVCQFISYYGITSGSVILQQAYVGFDTSVEEIYPVLLCGGRMVIVEKEHLLDPKKLKETILREKINIISCSPLLVKEMDYLAETGVKILISGGDVLKKEYFDSLKDTDIRIYNTYGPTEATVCASYYPVDLSADNSILPIGKPIDNSRIYIRNNDALCGIGVPGELCIAGSGIARGYLNRPELTEEKFGKDPYADGRMYHTGDLARWRPDGNIEYLGRIDEQVKIRGFRVELGEIESRILEINNVTNCAVIARSDDNGEMAIFAYIVSDQDISVTGIRDELSRNLPDYMLPSYLMRIEKLPVTRNGKLDKRALPKIEAKTGNEYVAPTNDLEDVICRIFSEILNVGKVGIKDSFFALGGHSLRATRLVNRIEEQTGKRLPLKTIFSDPTPEELAKILQNELDAEYASIPRAEEKEYYPMSSAQKRTYLVSQMDPDGILYNMPESYRLTGDLDPEELKEAMQKVIDRHEILRTQFLMVNGEPVQKVLSHVDADFEYFRDTETPEEDLIASFIRPFDLEKLPLVRIQLIDRGDHHLLSLDMHHIVGDGMSAVTFTQELNALYNGEELPPLTHQFKDYSEWMRTRDLSSQAEYWKSQFEEDIPVLDMPLDYIRPQGQSYKGGMVSLTTDKELGEKIRDLSAKTGSTEFMVFLSAAMVLLSKYSRQEDIVIGSPISGRTHKDTEGMLGMFVNTLAMRGRPEGKKTYQQFLSEIKETCLKAYENQEYPFEELVEAVDVVRDMSRNPLFDVMLVLQNNEDEQLHLGETKTQVAEVKDTISKIDLSFDICEDNGGYFIGLEYCSALFKEESAEDILSHFVVALDALTSNPDGKISDLELLTEKDLAIWEKYNSTSEEIPEESLENLVHQQCLKTPEKTAVVNGEDRLTYAQLWSKAEKVAGYLHAKGYGREDCIAVSGERSVWTIVNILGILAAGCTYVPENPEYPEERNRYMFENSKCKERLDKNSYISENMESCEPYCCESAPDTIAYTIYTSGSTGVPKGVVIKHAAAANTVLDINHKFNVDENSCIIGLSAYSFDLSVYDIFGALSTGAKLVIVNDQRDSAEIRKIINEENVTFWNSVPAIMSMYLMDGGKGCESLKDVLLSGDWIPVTLPDQIRDAFINAKVCSLGGATEGSIWSIYYPIGKVPQGAKSIPYGMPLANQQMLILNSSGKLCPVGTIGEICIAGKGVAEGYANQPEKTAAAFVDHPQFGYIYHTGDVGRMCLEGYIEFLGRLDDQLKIRGFRIELGEIESRIRAIEEIKDCAVIARADTNGDKAICAYLVSDQEISVSAVREELKKSLPDYMIPSYLMQIEKIPVTRNGKVDKRALPVIEAKTGNEYVAPRNEVEKAICDIFSEILNVEKVSIKDSFFTLGGHSLRATRLVNRIEEKTGRRIVLKEVFSHPTPEQLAELINGEDSSEYVSIPRAEGKEYYPMSSAQKRTYLICQMDPNGILYNMPESYRLTGEVEAERLKEAMQKVIDRHEILRSLFLMVNGEPVQRIMPKVAADFEFVVDAETSEEELISRFVRPFDLSKLPLVRIQLIDRGDHHLLNIDMHHIVGDGMSVGTFTKELNALYNGEELPDLTHQFKDYSEWMRTRDLSSQAEYWKNQFEEDIPVLDMPLDFIRPQEQSYRGSTVYESTGNELGEKIKKITRKTGTTEFMVLLSAAMVLLSKYSRQEDIVIGSPISGRTHKDTESMLGMFINSLALRGRPEGKKTYLEFLSEIKETCLKAYENQEYPFEELVEAVDVVRDMSRNPLFDVMLVLQNNEEESIHLNGTEAEYAESSDTIAKLDLTFNIWEQDGAYKIGLEYCTALFKKESARCILSHYIAVLNALTSAPEEKLANIEMLGLEERHKILVDFNNTDTDYPKDKTIVEMFEEQVERTPDNVAVVYEDASLTYAQLNAKANQLAHVLREEYGVKPDDFVAIEAVRSLEMIVGIYG
ncbi:MAG: amino acid adenylation domain-containing protein, partial [Clostridiales bacterium]|nr:amino acid adenylation domain-containing protein [Clostridiales bacterium]